MGDNAAALHTAANAVQALGRGFDGNFDTRLLYCKGIAGSRIVQIDEEHNRDLWLCDDLMVPNVSRDIYVSPQSVGRQRSGIYTFDEVGFSLSLLMLNIVCSYDSKLASGRSSVTGMIHENVISFCDISVLSVLFYFMCIFASIGGELRSGITSAFQRIFLEILIHIFHVWILLEGF